jgi:hypothetical protein
MGVRDGKVFSHEYDRSTPKAKEDHGVSTDKGYKYLLRLGSRELLPRGKGASWAIWRAVIGGVRLVGNLLGLTASGDLDRGGRRISVSCWG